MYFDVIVVAMMFTMVAVVATLMADRANVSPSKQFLGCTQENLVDRAKSLIISTIILWNITGAYIVADQINIWMQGAS